MRVAVGLDRAAAARVPNLAADLKVDDLRRSGWQVVGPRKEDDGRTWVRASKPFSNPAEASRVVAEITEVDGKPGPIRDVRVTREESFFKTRTSFTGRVDLSGGLAGFSDEDLTKRLGGAPLGVDVDELRRQLGDTLEQVFRFQVAARLPGSVTSNAPVGAEGGAQWSPKLGENVVLTATGEEWNTRRLVFGTIAVLAALALVVVLVVRVRRRRSA